MATYAWEARTRSGEMRKGAMEALEEAEVMSRLKGQGLTVSKVKKKGKDIEIKLPFMDGIDERDVVIFTRQFATMIDAGLPLVQCLDILANQTPNPQFQKR